MSSDPTALEAGSRLRVHHRWTRRRETTGGGRASLVRPTWRAERARPGWEGVDNTGTAPVIGLPGYPLATAVVFELFAMPLLAALQGRTPARDWVLARLDRDWASPLTSRTGYSSRSALPAGRPPARGAGSISQLARADAWWPIPAGQGNFPAGTQIKILPITATS
jgi:molybdopterin biosynthesis enzyme